MINKQGLELLEEFEGLSLTPYPCPKNIPTIGFGSTRYLDGTPVKLTDPAITKAQAYELLNSHIEAISKILDTFLKSVPFKLNENQFSALISFSYNLGLGPALTKGRSLNTALLSRNHKAIAESLLLYDKITLPNGSKEALPGLTRRRLAEKALYLS